MGNNSSLNTQEQNEAAAEEAMKLFKAFDKDADEGVSAEEWDEAFALLDTDGDGTISRKEWFLKQGTTEMYDAIFKKSSGNVTREEWQAAFEMLDANRDGMISTAEWLMRRRVRLSLSPLAMTANHWGVGIGNNFYEVLDAGWSGTEMVVAGPEGISALGEFAQEASAKERWLEAFRADVQEGKRPASQWLEEKEQPRARPEEEWNELETCGWTMKSDEEIEAWIKDWVERNPVYRRIDPFGREVNDQTFAIALIEWLTNSKVTKMTDNTKGRAVVYGGLAVLAVAAGGLYLANRAQHSPPSAQEADGEEGARTSSPSQDEKQLAKADDHHSRRSILGRARMSTYGSRQTLRPTMD